MMKPGKSDLQILIYHLLFALRATLSLCVLTQMIPVAISVLPWHLSLMLSSNFFISSSLGSFPITAPASTTFSSSFLISSYLTLDSSIAFPYALRTNATNTKSRKNTISRNRFIRRKQFIQYNEPILGEIIFLCDKFYNGVYKYLFLAHIFMNLELALWGLTGVFTSFFVIRLGILI